MSAGIILLMLGKKHLAWKRHRMIDDFKPPEQQPERPKVRFENVRSFHAAGNLATSRSMEQPAADEPAFRSPEQVASQSTYTEAAEPAEEKKSSLSTSQGSHRIGKLLHLLRHPTRKQTIIMAAVAVVAVGGAIAVFMSLHHAPQKQAPVVAIATSKPTLPPTPKPILSPLTGLPTTLDKTALPVTGVMIENSADARPQSGLDQAGVVYEAIAEAGITRFLALYQEADPSILGPVRSARPYYLQWVLAFDAGYAHVGGSPDALQQIKSLGVRDLDQFYNASAYHRISTRYAPHNMYTSMDNLHKLEQAKGYNNSTFTPFKRAAKEAPSPNPTARSIDFSISGSFYNVHYDYDAASNSYKRSEGGKPHIDNETKQQLSPKVVIALAMPYSLMSDGYHSMYNTQGSGKMLLFQNGTVTSGTWSKGDAKSQFVFKDDSGNEMELNPGQTWITVLSDISKASYHP